MRERWSALSSFANTVWKRNFVRFGILVVIVAGVGVLRGRGLRAAAPPATTLVSPDSVTVPVSKPYFVWDEESTATEYRLRVDDSSTTVIDEWFDASAVCDSGICAITSPDALPNDSYTWWIQTKNGDGDGPLSSSMTFSVVAYGVVDGGFAHSAAADRDGAPFGFGTNTYGQLGDGSTLDRYSAVPMYGLTEVVDVQAGEFHTVALRNDGTVWAAGYNGSGQLGDGTTVDSSVPVQVSGVTDAVAIAVGRNHALVLLEDGTVKAFGENGNGQLGDDTTTDRSTPVSVSGLTNIVAVGTGANHSLAVEDDGTVHAFGDNFYGQLGDGTQTERHTPVSVSSLTSVVLVGASSSANHSLALKSDGTVYGFGLNADGQLGDNSATDRTTPVQASGLTGIVALAAGESHSLALKSDGSIRAFGDNAEGQLGDGTTTDRLTSVAVSGLSSIKAIGAGQFHSLAVEDDGTVHSWGLGDGGQLGHGTTLSTTTALDVSEGDFLFRIAMPRIRVEGDTYENDLDVVVELEAPTQGATIYYTTNGSTPTTSDTSIISGASVLVTAPLTLKARAFATGYADSHVASETYAFKVATPDVDPEAGTYSSQQFVTLASATEGAELRYTTDGSTPTGASALYSDRIPLLQTTTVKVKGFRTSWTDSDLTTAVYTISPKAVGAGNSHSIALTSSGTVYAWGGNSAGQLGDGTTSPHDLPAPVSSLTGIVAVAAGANHNLALKNDRTVYAWGSNANGRLGDGTVTNRTTPVQVPSLSDIVAIAAGESHSMAVEADGTLWTFGLNNSGQLGDGTTTQRTSPVEITSLTDVIAIAAGYAHSLAVTSDGTVHAWGENGQYQLGNAATTDELEPIEIPGLTGIIAVAGGDLHSLALRDDGRVFSWGNGGQGALGNGSELNRIVPALSQMTNAVAIAAGESHSLAVKSDGSLWAWGQQADGQVGDGTTELKVYSPAELVGPTGGVHVSGGTNHSLGVASDGSVWAWGTNTSSQVGDGTTVKRPSPVRISDAGFDWKTATPTLDLAPGQYLDVQSVTVTTTDASASLYYTTNGVEPTETDATVTSGNTVAVDQNMTLKVKAFDTTFAPSNTTEAAYTIQAQTPGASPTQGAYGTAQNVTLSTATSGAAIRYTTDGSEPTGASTLYTGAINVDTSTTLRAKAFKTDWIDSTTMTQVYTMAFGTLTAPVMSPTPPGTHESSVEVTLSGPGIAALYYTTDGSEPTTSSTLYTAPFTLTTTTTLKAKAFHIDYTASSTTTGVYTIQVPDSTLGTSGGTYSAGQTVTISNTLVDALIHYTIDGATPTEDDPTIASGDAITLLDDLTLKVKAFKSGCEPSEVVEASYTVTGSIAPAVIAAGREFSLAIQPDDSGWVWGRNNQAQYGDGTTTQQEEPKAVSGYASVMDIDGGDYFTLAVETDGTALGSGRNANGQLGDGTTTQQNSPVSVGTLTDLVAIAAGGDHGLAIESDGSLWAFGKNTNGQLGDGTTTQRTSPVEITSLTNVIEIDAGLSHSLALKSDGTVYAFGLNNYGQLGDGTTTQRTSPVHVSSLSNIVAIAAGYEHSLALDSSGSVYSWGRNSLGNSLGDGTTTSHRTSPVAVITENGAQSSGLTKVVRIGAGYYHGYAIRADGSLWGWGANGESQIADGEPTSRRWAQPIAPLSGIGIVGATGGYAHTLAVTAGGELYGWAFNTNGQVGVGTTVSPQPVPVSLSADALDWRVTAPAMSPVGGGYNVEKSVTLTTPTAGATIYYTTNGSDPTTSDTEYTGAISITQSTTLKARAFKSGMADSVVTEEIYTLTAANPGFSPSGGTHNANQNVTISSTSQGVTIRYTTDGSFPDETSTVYSGPVLVDETLTLRAKAFRSGWTESNYTSFTYTMKVGTPSLSPTGGSFGSAQNVTVTAGTTGASLHYTLDGSTPTESSPTVTSGSTVAVNASGTLTVRSFNGPGWTPSDVKVGTFYISQGTAATPTADPAAGTYSEPQLVTLASTTTGAVIRYTLDGSEPTSSSPLFTKPVLVDWSATLKAKAYKPGWSASSTLSAAYTINLSNTVAPVTFDPPGGIYSTSQTVTLSSATAGATIYYTTNGDDPSALATSLTLQNGSCDADNTFLEATDAIDAGPSYLISASDGCTFRAADIGLRNGFEIDSDSRLTLELWPDASGGDVDVEHSLRLRAVAVKSGMTDSPVRAHDYLITGAVAAGYQHALALRTDGTVLSWGSNTSGALGRTTGGGAQPPDEVPDLTGVVAVAVNRDTAPTSFAIKQDGTLWGWGNGANGKLGNGSTSDQSAPTQVSTGTGLTDVTAVAPGAWHTLALKSDATVWAWGSRTDGALGDGSTSGLVTTPQQVSGLSNVVAIEAGYRLSVALKSDGSVYTWGLGQNGQMGNGATASKTTPNLVPNLTGITAIAAGGYHVLALQSQGERAGTIWAWGADDDGQLGDGGATDRSTPIRVADHVLKLSASYDASLLLQDGGFLKAVLGAGEHDGNTADGTAPGTSDEFLTLVRDSFVDVSAGNTIQLALRSDTTIREWGSLILSPNADGVALGDDTGINDDPDGDGLTNGQEWSLGTDPFDADTNGNGILDGIAIASGMSATDPDIDDDGLPNWVERALGTDPFNPDTDGDEVNDGEDDFPLDPTRDTAPSPNPSDTTPPTITLDEPTNATLVSSTP